MNSEKRISQDFSKPPREDSILNCIGDQKLVEDLILNEVYKVNAQGEEELTGDIRISKDSIIRLGDQNQRYGGKIGITIKAPYKVFQDPDRIVYVAKENLADKKVKVISRY